MLDLNNIEAIKKIDPQNTLESTNLLLKQCETAWDEVNKLELPHHIEGIKNIVFCGMGASGYGALVTKALLGRNIPYPTEVVNDYFLPDYVDSNTLVVLTSYSGTTEEVLSCANEAKTKGAKMIVITKGGVLEKFTRENDLPAYIFDGKLNLSGAPRVGCGYTIFGLLGLLNKLNIIDIEEHEITNSFTRIREIFENIKNQAQKDVRIFENKIPIIFTAEHLAGNAQIFRNQFNETSKTFSAYFLIPDLNHHLMEGLRFPKNAPLHFLAIDSPNFSDKVRKRIKLTADIIKQNNYPVHEVLTTGSTIYEDFIETLIYGAFLTLYLGLNYKQNPAINPYVDWFKDQLAK